MKGKQGVLSSKLFRRPVASVFDSPPSSSDGGSVLLKACDQALGLHLLRFRRPVAPGTRRLHMIG